MSEHVRKVVPVVIRETKPTRTFSWLLIVFVAVTLALLVTGCQTFTDTTVKTKSAANEAVAVGSLRTISSAEAAYSISHDGDYGTFEELVKAGNLDVRFGGERPVMGGYVLSMKVTPKDSGGRPASYAVNADPQQDVAAASTGTRHLYMDSTDSTIHVNAKQTASSSDPQL